MDLQRTLEQDGDHFAIIKTSSHAAKLYISCSDHEHDVIYIELIDECDQDWVRAGADKNVCDWAIGHEPMGFAVEGTFADAVRNAAGWMAVECRAMDDVRAYFGQPDDVEASNTLTFRDRDYLVKRVSPIAAEMYALCEEHEHREYCMILAMGGTERWSSFRLGSDTPMYHHYGDFAGLAQQVANLLHRECVSMDELTDFFN